MQLASIELTCFKAFAEARFDIAPLTVLIGPNNAGKSTMLQALALLNQSAGAGTITTAGGIVDLGQSVEALRHRNGNGPSAAERWSLQVQWSDRHITADPISARDVEVEFRVNPSENYRGADSQARVTIHSDSYRDTVLTTQFPAAGEAELAIQESSDGNTTQQVIRKNRILQTNPFAFVVNDPRQPKIVSRATQGAPPEADFWDLAVQYLESAASALQSYRYVGPDRAVSQSVFALGTQASSNPRTASEVLDTLAYDKAVLQAVSTRCEHMFGFGIDIDLVQNRQVALVAIDSDGTRMNAVNVGSGLVQLVWIVLELELALRYRQTAAIEITPIIGIEEPEIHLHPAKQPEMARILADYAKRGPRIICTTQSEHLLMAILQLVLEKTLRPEDLSVYHVDRGQAQKLTVDDQGRLSEGLKGFFEANEEQLLERLNLLMSRG